MIFADNQINPENFFDHAQRREKFKFLAEWGHSTKFGQGTQFFRVYL